MPEKSVREMGALERVHNSLAAKVFHATMMGTALLGFISLLMGLALYVYALGGQYIAEAFGLARSTATVVREVMDVEPLADGVMRVYRGLSKAQREQTGTQEYRALFEHVTEDEDYQLLRAVLGEFCGSGDVDDLYLAVYDRESSAIIYLCDPDEREGYVCEPGDWEELEARELNKFLDWNGTGRLYDIGNTKEYGWLCTAGVPLLDASGESQVFLLADVTLGNLLAGAKTFALQYLVTLLVVMVLFALLMTRHMKKNLVAPINAIAEAAQGYIKDKRAGVPVTDHFSRLNIRTGDEVENLHLIMADMERDLADYEENLTRAVVEKERIGTELSLATRIQADMLPSIFPPFPERTELNIYASMTPAKEVGGDFYDFFLIDDDHLGMVMADVSGKGVPAALFMMASKILIQNHILSGRSPRETLEMFNEQICQNNREEMFVTVWLGVLDLTSGTVIAANAGHEYPILKTPGGGFTVVKDRHGFVIGGMKGMHYTEYEMRMEPGSKLFLYTDGIPEATDENNELFGMDRLLRALNEAADGTPQEIVDSVHSAVDLFVGNGPQFDDLTMLCVEYTGLKEGERSPMRELSILATVENLPVVTDFVNAELEAMDCPMKAQMQIDVAIDELFTNIASYAYAPETGKAVIRFEAQDGPRGAVISFIDSGVPFNPLESRDPDVTLSAEERQAGGLGIFLVKKTMDDVSYEYVDGKNVLRIRKDF